MIEGPETERLFVAITLPEAVREALRALAEPLHGVSWVRREQLHVTLRFLGDVQTDRMEGVCERLADIRVEPFILPVESVGAFPPKRPPRVIWAGTGAGHPRLFQLRQRLDDSLIAAGIEFDLRRFEPHITVARCPEAAAPGVAQWLHRHREFSAPPFRVEAFDLYSSVLGPGGAEHALLRRFELSAAKV
jgi:2'-5' RNA ligase